MAFQSDATSTDRGLLACASQSDDEAFGGLVEPYRSELHAHCYRMLGSVHDAEDALQDALLRAWRGLSGFDRRRPLRPWLYKIATNACIDEIARRPKRGLPFDYGPPTDPRGDHPQARPADAAWLEPYPDEQLRLADGYASPEARYEQREAVELAFIAALQYLPPRQRAALILRDVLGFSAKEVSEALDTTAPSVNSALQRARETVKARLPDQSQQATMRSLGDTRLRDIVQRFIDAFESGDVQAIVAMLAEDATFGMPPYSGWFHGRDALADSWLMPGEPPVGLRYVPTRANGQLAFGAYRLEPNRGRYTPIALDVLALKGPRIIAITAFRLPPAFPPFGLPDTLPLSPGGARQEASTSRVWLRPERTTTR